MPVPWSVCVWTLVLGPFCLGTLHRSLRVGLSLSHSQTDRTESPPESDHQNLEIGDWGRPTEFGPFLTSSLGNWSHGVDIEQREIGVDPLDRQHRASNTPALRTVRPARERVRRGTGHEASPTAVKSEVWESKKLRCSTSIQKPRSSSMEDRVPTPWRLAQNVHDHWMGRGTPPLCNFWMVGGCVHLKTHTRCGRP